MFSYQTGFLFCHIGQAPEVGLWGAGVARGSKKISNMVMYDDKQNRLQVKLLLSGQTGDLGGRSMIKYH